MRTINNALKIVMLISIISLCTINLCGIASGYRNQARTDSEMQSYAPQPRTKQTQNEPVSDPDSDNSAQLCVYRDVGIALPCAVQPLSDYTAGLQQEPIAEPEQLPLPVVNQFIADMQNEINPDIIAWLSISGTKIDYPVVKAADNDYYLQHDVYGRESVSGTLFADYRCPGQFSGFNTIIHGHNMRNRSMFGTLRLYSSPDYLEENRHGVLRTSTDTYSVEVFAYMVTSFDDPEIYANPPSEEAFLEYVKENARIYREPESGVTKVLALSTCAYDFDGARIVVLASLKEQ